MTRWARRAALAAMLLSLSGCALFDAEAVAVLRDIEAGDRPSDLKASTPTPRVAPLSWRLGDRRMRGDLFIPAEPPLAALLLTPGLSRDGKDDRRLQALARSFARARFLTLTPEIPGSRAMRFSPDDAAAIGAALQALDREVRARGVPPRIGAAAISYAVGPAIFAALDHDPDGALDFLIALGGYHDARAVLAFVTTDRVRDPRAGGWTRRDAHPLGRWFLARSLAGEVMDPADRAALTAWADAGMAAPDAALAPPIGLGAEGASVLALVQNRDPDAVDRLVAAAPRTVRRAVGALSPAGRDLAPLAGKLILIHGEEDRVTPPEESIALARRVPDTALFLVPTFSHIELRQVGLDGKRVLAEAMVEILDRRDGG